MSEPLRQMLRASVEHEHSKTRYWAEGDRIVMAGIGGPVYLDHGQADQLLVIWHQAGADEDFDALHDALVKAGGIPW